MNALSLLEQTPTYTDHDVPYEVSIDDTVHGYMRINRDIPQDIEPENDRWWDSLDHQKEAPPYLDRTLNQDEDFPLDFDRCDYAPLLNQEADQEVLESIEDEGMSYLVIQENQVVGEAILRENVAEEWRRSPEPLVYVSPGQERAGELIFPPPPPEMPDWHNPDPFLPVR